MHQLGTDTFRHLYKLWEQGVFDLLLAEGKITEEVVANIRSWKHSGFSVDQSVRVETGHTEGIQRLIEYFLRCPLSKARMIEVTEQGRVISKTGNNRLGRFPEAASKDLLAGPKRNFQVFEPLDVLAEVTQHIPEAGEHLIRYSGFYSNKSRGLRTKGQAVSRRPESGCPLRVWRNALDSLKLPLCLREPKLPVPLTLACGRLGRILALGELQVQTGRGSSFHAELRGFLIVATHG